MNTQPCCPILSSALCLNRARPQPAELPQLLAGGVEGTQGLSGPFDDGDRGHGWSDGG